MQNHLGANSIRQGYSKEVLLQESLSSGVDAQSRGATDRNEHQVLIQLCYNMNM